ncbi:MAG TPA: type II toxin-antitoxin system VapC family toxin [Thermoanaerobaculia bacterium]
MSSSRELLLLDTNVVLHVVRGNEIGHRVDALFHIRHRADRPLISVVSIGECLALARQWNWGSEKRATLEQLLRELVVVDIQAREILERYAELHSWSRQHGRTLGDNDLWIAATAAAVNAHLITTDADFDSLHPQHVRRTYIETSVN